QPARRAGGDLVELECGGRDGHWQRVGDRRGGRSSDDYRDERGADWDGGPHGHHRASGVGGSEPGDGEPAGGADGPVDGDAAGRERQPARRAGGDLVELEYGGRDGQWQRAGDWGRGGSWDDHGGERGQERHGGNHRDGGHDQPGQRGGSRGDGRDGQLGDAGVHRGNRWDGGAGEL